MNNQRSDSLHCHGAGVQQGLGGCNTPLLPGFCQREKRERKRGREDGNVSFQNSRYEAHVLITLRRKVLKYFSDLRVRDVRYVR